MTDSKYIIRVDHRSPHIRTVYRIASVHYYSVMDTFIIIIMVVCIYIYIYIYYVGSMKSFDILMARGYLDFLRLGFSAYTLAPAAITYFVYDILYAESTGILFLKKMKVKNLDIRSNIVYYYVLL
jgi:hypothetical protein